MRISGFRVEMAPNRLIAQANSKVGGKVEVRITQSPANPELVQIRAYFIGKLLFGPDDDTRAKVRIPLADAISRTPLEALKAAYIKRSTHRTIQFCGDSHHLPGSLWV